ncbi:MAG: hypothetical protein M3367_01105 [Acidobacteriota bacterium]|nr:hypothetical protein [Acidobacteriota bacterium]
MKYKKGGNIFASAFHSLQYYSSSPLDTISNPNLEIFGASKAQDAIAL